METICDRQTHPGRYRAIDPRPAPREGGGLMPSPGNRVDSGLFPSEAEIARRFSQDTTGWSSKVIILEREGFPRVDPLMGGRYWPACKAWWNRRYGLGSFEVLQPDEGEDLEALK
jgi:hypothetical protein